MTSGTVVTSRPSSGKPSKDRFAPRRCLGWWWRLPVAACVCFWPMPNASRARFSPETLGLLGPFAPSPHLAGPHLIDLG